MKKTILFIIVSIFLLSLFLGVPQPSYSQENNTITIASFNIQVFGKTKASKNDVILILAKIISRYDVVAIQEIRDESNTAIKKLEKEVDSVE